MKFFKPISTNLIYFFFAMSAIDDSQTKMPLVLTIRELNILGATSIYKVFSMGT